jgi:hypothetical protein
LCDFIREHLHYAIVEFKMQIYICIAMLKIDLDNHIDLLHYVDMYLLALILVLSSTPDLIAIRVL